MNVNYAFSPATEIDIQEAITCYKTKAYFDMYVELLKLGIISREEFVRRTRHAVTFNPEPLPKET